MQPFSRTTARSIGATLAATVLFALVACTNTAPPEVPTPDAAPPPSVIPSPESTPSGSAAATFEADGLTWQALTDAAQVPRELVVSGTITYLTDQAGVVFRLDDGQAEPVLDLTDKILTPSSSSLELGLTGFALSPDFASTGDLYIVTTEATSSADTVPGAVATAVLTRYTADPGTGDIDESTSFEVMRLPLSSRDHVGGELAFDAAGALYVGIGAKDGALAAQDPTSPFGKIYRIVPTGHGYDVPQGNPQIEGALVPGMFSLGYRNPWRFASTDEGVLLAEALWTTKDQQVSIPVAGGNSGYPLVRETCWVQGALAAACTATPDGAPITAPVLEYPSDIGQIASGIAAVPSTHSAALGGSVVVTDWDAGEIIVATPGSTPWPYVTKELPADMVDDRLVWDIAATDTDLYLMTTSRGMTDGIVYRLAGE